MLKPKKESKKVAVSFRISEDLNNRMKNVKELSRTKGYIFTLQNEIEKFLEKQIREAESELKEIDDSNVKEQVK